MDAAPGVDMGAMPPAVPSHVKAKVVKDAATQAWADSSVHRVVGFVATGFGVATHITGILLVAIYSGDTTSTVYKVGQALLVIGASAFSGGAMHNVGTTMHQNRVLQANTD